MSLRGGLWPGVGRQRGPLRAAYVGGALDKGAVREGRRRGTDGWGATESAPPSGCGGKLESITALSVPWAGAEAFPAEAGFWPGADAAAAAAPTCRRRGGVVLGAEPAGACAAVGVGAGGVSGAGADCLLAVRFCALLTGWWLA